MVDVKNLIIGAIISVILVMFLAYGTNLVYKSPDYNTYCNYTNIMPAKPNINCNLSQQVDLKIQSCYSSQGTPMPVYDENGCQRDVTCSTCNKDYEKADESYSQNMFIISLIVGIVIIIISALFIPVPSVAGGLMLGSLFFIIYGTARYWRFMNDWLRFIILGIVLAILIYLGYRLASREKNDSKKRVRK